MRRSLTYLLYSLAAAGSLVAMVGCDVDINEDRMCTYTVQLRYDYNEENSTNENKILYWVDYIDEYIFDENDLLYSIRRVTDEECTEYMNSELQLEPGNYSVIAVGNGDCSREWDARTGLRPMIGMTRREDLRMTLENVNTFEDGTKGPCGELYHGYRTFNVREEGGATRVRVDMVDAHFQLRFRVTWQNVRSQPEYGVYYAILKGIPSQYNLMPEYVYLPGSWTAEHHEYSMDTYPHTDNNVVHHIPYTGYEGANMLNHSNTTYMNVDGEVWGEFVNYRIKTDTRPILTLYYAVNGTRADEDPMMLPKEIDLGAYFDWFDYELDHELKQQYQLDIVVDGDQIIISPMTGMNIADWTDGGSL